MIQIAWECVNCNTVGAVIKSETKSAWDYLYEAEREHKELNPLCEKQFILPLADIDKKELEVI